MFLFFPLTSPKPPYFAAGNLWLLVLASFFPLHRAFKGPSALPLQKKKKAQRGGRHAVAAWLKNIDFPYRRPHVLPFKGAALRVEMPALMEYDYLHLAGGTQLADVRQAEGVKCVCSALYFCMQTSAL